jgi:hypothetical protein
MTARALDKAARDDIHRRVIAAVRQELGEQAQLAGHCLEIAWQGHHLIKSLPAAPRTIIQAGSASWPRVPPELDDGQGPTHFSYEWDKDSDAARLLRLGLALVVRRADGLVACSLPEVHVWLACPETQELIDFSAGLLPAACKAAIGLEWLAPAPPDYLWAACTALPDGVSYRPSREAIDCVLAILRQQGRRYP